MGTLAGVRDERRGFKTVLSQFLFAAVCGMILLDNRGDTLLKIAPPFSAAVVRGIHDLLLANLEAPTFRLTHDPSEGPGAWSTPCGNLGFIGGEIGSPTVSDRFPALAPPERRSILGHVGDEPVVSRGDETTW